MGQNGSVPVGVRQPWSDSTALGPPPESGTGSRLQSGGSVATCGSDGSGQLRRVQASTWSGGGGGVRAEQVQRPQLPARSGPDRLLRCPCHRWCRSGAAGRCCTTLRQQRQPEPRQNRPAQQLPGEETPRGRFSLPTRSSTSLSGSSRRRRASCSAGVAALGGRWWGRPGRGRSGSGESAARPRTVTLAVTGQQRAAAGRGRTPRSGCGRWNQERPVPRRGSVELQRYDCGNRNGWWQQGTALPAGGTGGRFVAAGGGGTTVRATEIGSATAAARVRTAKRRATADRGSASAAG